MRFLLVLFALAIFPMTTLADTFEFISFTPPPGWTKQPMADGMTYRRPTGVGLVYFYNSYASTGTSLAEFGTIWRSKVAATIPGPIPQTETRQEGIYSVSLGVTKLDTQGSITYVALFTVVGRGRALGVLVMATGDDVFREAGVLLDSVKLDQTFGATPAPATGTIDVDFEVPPGYASSRDGNLILFKPAKIDRDTPCVYGLSPARASTGSLERDARVAILEPLPGWQIKSDHYNAMRGISAAGWQYFWYRTDVQQMAGGSMQYLQAMSMAFQTGQGRVNVFWGFGPPAQCTLDDFAFAGLFHSLRPRGWTSDGGKAFAKELVGTWRNTEAVGMAQYRFAANGRYEYGQGTSTTFGNLETRTGSVADGTYSLRGSELLLTGGRRAGKYLVRVYEDFSGGMWLKTMSVLDRSSNPPLEVRYLSVRE